MKIKFIILITASFIFFCGCSKDVKHITYELKKIGIVTVDAVDDITTKSFINQYGDNTEPIWIIKHSINYPNENNTGDIDDPYRIGFHFKHIGKYKDKPVRSYNYDLCSDGKRDFTKNIENYRGYTSLIDNEEVLHIYLAIGTMKERGFINDSLNSRGDVCVYIQFEQGHMGGDVDIYESNSIVYSTQEINNALAEYEALQ